jgi:O-antigen ligase
MRDAQDLAWFAWAYVVASGALVWMAFFVFQVSLTADGALYRLSGLETWDGNDLGCVLLPGLALSLLLWRTSRGMPRLLSGVVILGIAMTVARSGSRGTLVGLLVFGLAWLFSLRAVPLYKRLAVLAITGVALFIAAPPGYWRQMGTLLHPTQDYNWSAEFGRKEATLRGLQYMLDHPVFGLGVGNFSRAEGTISEVAQAWQPGMRGVPWRAAHNSYVQAGAELGVPGLVVWASLVLGGVVGMARLRRRVPRDWMHAGRDERFLYHAPGYLLLAMVGFAVTSAFVSFAWLDPIYILAALMTGVYVAISAKRRQQGLSSLPLTRSGGPGRAYRETGQGVLLWPPRS